MSQNIWETQDKVLLQRQKRRSQLVLSYLKGSLNHAILDIGCAEGYATSWFASFGAYVVGVELDYKSLCIAHQKVQNVEFVNASIDSLPFRDEFFDAICILEVLEHLNAEYQKAGLMEADRVLRTKGNIIISVPYKENIVQTKCIHCGKLTPLYGHLQSMNESNVEEVLPEHKYRLIKNCRLPNFPIISCSSALKSLPLPIWLLLNRILGLIGKGYWIVLHYTRKL